MSKVIERILHDSLHFVFPKNCFEELLIRFNFNNHECSSLVLSRLLGLIITAGSMMLLVPQIWKVHSARSARGLSLMAQVLALISAGSASAYSYQSRFVFSQWGDSFFIAIQLIIIIMQIFWFSGRRSFAIAFLMGVSAISVAILRGMVPMDLLTGLQALTIPIMVASKAIQIRENWKNQSTGQLAFVSIVLQLGGSMARIFTSIRETGDSLMIATYAIAALLNAVLFYQFIIYWNSEKKKTNKKKR